MSYLVLARKWRPQTFAEVVGQDHVRRTLVNSIESGRIGHAFLFAGPRGVGKTTMARLLAKAVNCKFRKGSEPCNECSSCQEITSGNAIDVLEIDGASNRGIDEIRELRENAQYAPSSLMFKVYIIDEVHMLTGPAFNALLKTLEEPPEHVKFILATTELHKVPVTIRSRCQRYQFKRMAVEDIAGQLRTIVKAESIATSERALQILARMADGSMRDGESILDQMIAFSDGEITYEMVLDLLGRLDPEIIHELGSAILQGNPSHALALVHRFLSDGGDIVQILPELMEYFRDLLVIAALDKPETLMERHEQQIAAMRELVGSFSMDKLSVYYRVISEGERQVRYSPLPRAELDTVILQLCRLHHLIALDRLIQKTDRLEVIVTGEPRKAEAVLQALTPAQQAQHTMPSSRLPTATPPQTGQVAEPADESREVLGQKQLDPVVEPAPKLTMPGKPSDNAGGCDLGGFAALPSDEVLVDIWRQVVEGITQNRPLRAILEHAGLQNRHDGFLTIVFGADDPEFYKDKVEERESYTLLTEILQKRLGGKVNLRVAVSTNFHKTIIHQVLEEKTAKVKDQVRKVAQNPLIRDAVEIFQGTVVKVIERTEDSMLSCQENGDQS